MTAAADPIAVIGVALRVPGARTFDQFFTRLCDGVESATRFAATAPPQPLPAGSVFVPVRGVIDDADAFDPALFGLTDRHAALIAPERRKFLECAWEALEVAGYLGATAVGVYAMPSSRDYYYAHQDRVARHERDLLYGADLAALTARQLDLRGPCFTLDGNCSGGLQVVHLACQALLANECDLALAGATAISIDDTPGYVTTPGRELSPDGRCRPFDAAAQGTAPGDGVGVVLLKRLDDAVRDRDFIHAVILGSATNHAGAARPVFAAHVALIEDALAVAGVGAAELGYVEAHGAGSPDGDAAEVAALADAFRRHTAAKGFCGLGSVKPNLGHSGGPTGLAMLMKVAGALAREQLPPTLGFAVANPRIAFERTAFHVVTARRAWPRGAVPRRAGVGVFGEEISNVFLIVEEPPRPPPPALAPGWLLVPVSARTPAALADARRQLRDHLQAHPELALADVAFTLQLGRRHFAERWAAVVHDRAGLLQALGDAGTVGAPDRARDPGRGLVEELARSWLAGGSVEFAALHRDHRPRRVPLPTYPFARTPLSLRSTP